MTKKKHIFETINGLNEVYLTDNQLWEQMSPEERENNLFTMTEPLLRVVVQIIDGGFIREMELERSGPLSYLRKELRKIDLVYGDCHRYIQLTAAKTTYKDDDARYHLYFNLV